MSQLEGVPLFEPGLPFSAPAKEAGFQAEFRPRTLRGKPGTGSAWANHYRRMLMVSDAVVISASTVCADLLWFGVRGAGGESSALGLQYLIVAAGVSTAWMLALSVHRTRDPRVVGIGVDEYRRILNATLLLIGLLAMASLLFQVEVARGYFALAFPIGLLGLVGSRWMLRRWLMRQRRFGHYLSRVVVIGYPEDARYVISQIGKKSGAAYEVVGVALPETDTPAELTVNGHAFPVVASFRSVVRAVAAVEADAVIVAGQVDGGGRYIQELGWQLEELCTELILTTGMTNVAGPRIHSRPVEGLPLMHVELPQYTGAKHVMKRLLDVVLAAAALLALAPVLAVLAVLIKMDSPGPAIFRQERVGKDGGRFIMYKFRSMVETAEEELAALLEKNEGAGVLFKMQHDPRVTKVGTWMRRYSLDELPQFWNVLLGNMSLVGPRPPLEREVNGYESHVHRRLYIKPGLTGMWQINGRSQLNWEDSVRLDLYYVENWSLAGDIIILWRTAREMIRPVGAY